MLKYLFYTSLISLFILSCQNEESHERVEIKTLAHDTLHAVDYASDNFDKQQGVEVIQSELDFGKLLIEIESQFGWENMEEVWQDRRDEWVLNCQNAITLEDKGALLIEFENNILRKDLDKDWRQFRSKWVEEIRTTKTNQLTGSALIELDSRILWDNVSPNWPLSRADWAHACQALN